MSATGNKNRVISWPSHTVALITSSKKDYMTREAIANHKALFPFAVEHVTQADIASCEKLLLERVGDDIVVRIR